MLLNTYKYVFCDATYMMRKNLAVLQNQYDKDGTDYDVGDAIKMMIWSVKKIIRDYDSADCIVLLHDTWSPTIGGYFAGALINRYKEKLKKEGKEDSAKEYKGDRVYYTEKDLTADLEEEDRKRIESDIKRNKVKKKLKDIMLNDFWRFGMINVSVPGYEADYLAYIFSSMAFNEDKKSAIVSRDSDWQNLSSPMCDMINLPVGKNPYSIITYKDRIDQIGGLPDGMSLYQYMSYRDSLFGSHNNMTRTLSPEVKLKEKDAISRVFNNKDFSIVSDYDLFKVQLQTFNVNEYPDLSKVLDIYKNIPNLSKLSTTAEFREWADSLGVNISNKYYEDFINRLDSKLYNHG